LIGHTVQRALHRRNAFGIFAIAGAAKFMQHSLEDRSFVMARSPRLKEAMKAFS
jgi:hypothetical protein